MIPLRTLLGLGAAVTFAAAAGADDRARVAAVTAPATDFSQAERFEARPAGAATARTPLMATLPPEARMQATLGEAIFGKLWVAAPATTRASDGLGPLYNARACAVCHPGGGRGDSAVAHLGQPGPHGPLPDPVFGVQLQDHAVTGLAAEGQLIVSWIENTVALAGGETAHLRKPQVATDAPLAPATRMSLRMPPALFGIGLIAAIAADDIAAGADPDDRDGDGIKGQLPPGRFGHKAGTDDLTRMVALAFRNDMGLSTPLFPDPAGDCMPAQTACRAAPSGEDPGLRDGREVSGEALARTVDYVAALTLPMRDPGAELPGKAAFYQAGCPACHRPKFVTARTPDDPARSFQLIWPYSDFLLHDMGPDLADDLPEPGVSGAQWRTAPLWGLGTTGRQNFLHDGRARSPLEAVLWHGGEAAPARARVVAMDPETRAALIRYLESL